MSVLLLALLLRAGAEPPPVPDAHPLSLRSTADRGSVRLGEPFDYTIEIRHRPEERYTLRPGAAMDPFFAGEARCRRDPRGGEAVTTCALPLSLFALGEAEVPELAFDAEGPGGKALLRVPGPRVAAVPVTDPSAPPEALPLRDLAPPVPVWVRSLRVVWWALGAAAAAGLAALGWRGVRAWRRRARRAPAPPGPAERFERQLDALEVEGLGAELACARLVELVRGYLAAVAAVPALELTTGELVAALRRTRDPRLDVDGLAALLAEADGVKFARAPAGPGAWAAALAYGRALLARTRPTPPDAGAARRKERA